MCDLFRVRFDIFELPRPDLPDTTGEDKTLKKNMRRIQAKFISVILAFIFFNCSSSGDTSLELVAFCSLCFFSLPVGLGLYVCTSDTMCGRQNEAAIPSPRFSPSFSFS